MQAVDEQIAKLIMMISLLFYASFSVAQVATPASSEPPLFFQSTQKPVPAPVLLPITQIQTELKYQLTRHRSIVINHHRLKTYKQLATLYKQRTYEPIWFNEQGIVTTRVYPLVNALRNAWEDGLEPSIYNLARIEHYLVQLPKKAKQWMYFEFLLTDAFIRYSQHLHHGHVDPRKIDDEWFISPNKKWRAINVLQNSLESDTYTEMLANLAPPHESYKRLRHALKHYITHVSKQTWRKIEKGESLREGDNDPRIAILRERLLLSGELDADIVKQKIFCSTNENIVPLENTKAHAKQADLLIQQPKEHHLEAQNLPLPAASSCINIHTYNSDLVDAVKRFQARYGLKPDGVVGSNTVTAFNIPIAEHIEQIKINLERWRWLPRDLGKKYIAVNMAGFYLEVFDNNKRVKNMKVIVGKTYRRTPVFSNSMTYLVFNPRWHVPYRIAVEDILPKLRKNKNYLTNQGIRVFSNSSEVNGSAIDWSQVSAHNFPYRFRQNPGRRNALGKIKFMFPNRFAVYLHDTSSRNLFNRTVRTFSSGCIRVEHPLALAQYVLKGHNKWTENRISKVFKGKKTYKVPLPSPIPVYLLYWTTWVDDNGAVQFRRDIYGRDKRLGKVFAQRSRG